VGSAVSVIILVAVLLFAVVRPRGLPEAVAAVPAAGLVVALGLVPARAAVRELGALGPTVGFLAAVLVLAHLRLRGRAERAVVAACADADLLVLARDGDHTRLGPRSIGHATRFVLDHAPCRVLLVWPDEGALPPRS
jgi:nucleotide-binding universal stress UspA family protein